MLDTIEAGLPSPLGLPNPDGTTCYINAAIQILLSTPNLSEANQRMHRYITLINKISPFSIQISQLMKAFKAVICAADDLRNDFLSNMPPATMKSHYQKLLDEKKSAQTLYQHLMTASEELANNVSELFRVLIEVEPLWAELMCLVQETQSSTQFSDELPMEFPKQLERFHAINQAAFVQFDQINAVLEPSKRQVASSLYPLIKALDANKNSISTISRQIHTLLWPQLYKAIRNTSSFKEQRGNQQSDSDEIVCLFYTLLAIPATFPVHQEIICPALNYPAPEAQALLQLNLQSAGLRENLTWAATPLPNPNDTKSHVGLLSSLFTAQNSEIDGFAHPLDRHTKNKRYVVAQKKLSFCLPANQMPLSLNIRLLHNTFYTAFGHECLEPIRYEIPSVINIPASDTSSHVYVLAAFSTKSGSKQGGHYWGWRREGAVWKYYNDAVVSSEMSHALNETKFPSTVDNYLKNNNSMFPYTLLYVRADVFCKQYNLTCPSHEELTALGKKAMSEASNKCKNAYEPFSTSPVYPFRPSLIKSPEESESHRFPRPNDFPGDLITETQFSIEVGFAYNQNDMSLICKSNELESHSPLTQKGFFSKSLSCYPQMRPVANTLSCLLRPLLACSMWGEKIFSQLYRKCYGKTKVQDEEEIRPLHRAIHIEDNTGYLGARYRTTATTQQQEEMRIPWQIL